MRIMLTPSPCLQQRFHHQHLLQVWVFDLHGAGEIPAVVGLESAPLIQQPLRVAVLPGIGISVEKAFVQWIVNVGTTLGRVAENLSIGIYCLLRSAQTRQHMSPGAQYIGWELAMLR